MRWKYQTVTISYDKKEHKNWVVERSGQSPLVGLPMILEAKGSEGWELVSLIPESFLASPGFGTWNVEPVTYRATFKRPIDG